MSRLYNILNAIIPTNGSNANGSWTKFPDGTMICKKTISGTYNFTTAFGSMYETPKILLGDWPQPFVDTPTVSTSTSLNTAVVEQVVNVTSTSAGATWLMRPNSASSNSCAISIIGIGKWK